MTSQTNSGIQTDRSMDRQTDRKVEGDGVGRLARQTNSGIQTDEQTNAMDGERQTKQTPAKQVK